MPFAEARLWRWILLVVMAVGFTTVAYMGVRTYQDAPPIPDFAGPQGAVLASKADVLAGQAVFQRYALMNYGSMFGDGANRGPDFTADALHTVALAMRAHYEREAGAEADIDDRSAIAARVQREIKANTYDASKNRVTLSAGQVAAYRALEGHYAAFFGKGPGTFQPAGYLKDPAEIRQLTAFFFWGAWVCGAERPGGTASYTHNWPYDEDAGNRPSAPVLLWSILGVLGLALGIGLVLFAHGKLEASKAADDSPRNASVLTVEKLRGFVATPGQRAAYQFFVAAASLFGLQVLAGVLTVHDFIGFTHFFGVDLAEIFPITVTRSWHLQWAILWIVACWIGASIFVLPMISGHEPAGQGRWTNGLFGLFVFLTAGSAVGIYMGPKGLLDGLWHLLGNQGWEYVELGKLWQVLLFGALALWCFIVFRGIRPGLRRFDPASLPTWLSYTILTVLVLFLAGFVATPETNFVIADFWRWMVVHMWVEAFLEVFTTAIVACFMVLMGLTSVHTATRVVFIGSVLFLGSGIIGISHNFYWNAKSVETLALGSIFSTLQVVPLFLLALEAWKTRRLPIEATDGQVGTFGQSAAFLFLLGVNFWNCYGAGVLGLMLNLPIINYYEHGTYLTVNHGHAALMGVYGNLSIAAMLFCARYVVPLDRWSERATRVIFWSLNLGLMLMVVLDLFPLGVLQFQDVLEHGLWHARSLAFVEGPEFQQLTWLRAIGGYVFVFGGVVPLWWFVASRWRAVRRQARGTSVDRAA